MILQSVVTCPHCATAKSETMPTDACQFFYECCRCGVRLRPAFSFWWLACSVVSRRRAAHNWVTLGRFDGSRESSGWARATGVDEPHWSRPLEITSFQAFNSKASGLH